MSDDVRTPASHAFAPNPGGVVEFHIWGTDPEGNLVLSIDGPQRWRRPVTGVDEGGGLIVSPEPKFKVSTLTTSDYLIAVFGDDLVDLIRDHSTHYRMGEDGPIGDAPLIRRQGDYS